MQFCVKGLAYELEYAFRVVAEEGVQQLGPLRWKVVLTSLLSIFPGVRYTDMSTCEMQAVPVR